MQILFLCTGNSCRSILAEAIFNELAPDGWSAVSAGNHPTGYVHPKAIAVLKQHRIKTDGFISKSWDNLEKTPNIVITVCSSAAGETCPAYLGKAIKSHWGLEDPAKATGTEQEIMAVFEETFNRLQQGISFFLQHPLNELSSDDLQSLMNTVSQRFFTNNISIVDGVMK